MTGGSLFLLMLQVGHHLLLLLLVLLRVFKVTSHVMAHSGPGQSQIVQNVPLLHGEMALGFHQQQVVVVVAGRHGRTDNRAHVRRAAPAVFGGGRRKQRLLLLLAVPLCSAVCQMDGQSFVALMLLLLVVVDVDASTRGDMTALV